MWPNPQETVDLVTITEEILNEKLYFLCSENSVMTLNPAKLYLSKVNKSHWRRSGIFTVNFEHTPHLFLVFLLLTLNKKMPVGKCCHTTMCKLLSFFWTIVTFSPAFTLNVTPCNANGSSGLKRKIKPYKA